MLNTVHAYLNHKRNERGLTLGKIEALIEQKHPELSMSDSKLSKIFKDSSYKLSIEDLFIIVEAMGLDKREILAILGEQEYRASESVDYKGAAELIPEFERREAALVSYYKEQLEKEAVLRNNINHAFSEAKSVFDRTVEILRKDRASEREDHFAALKRRDETYDRAVGHLKAQLIDLKEENKLLRERAASAESARDQIDKRMHNVFWGMLIALLTVLGVFILFIIVDVPQIGAGW